MAFHTKRHFDEDRKLIVIRLSGELDITSSPEFKKIAQKEYEKYESSFFIDGENLEYMDSTGLGAFIFLINLIKEKNHTITFSGLKPNIRKLFAITRMEDLFQFEGEGE